MRLLVSAEAAALVSKLLNEREALRRRADYDRADQIRDTLQRKGVKMDDRRKQWWRMAGVPASIRALNPDGRWTAGGGKWGEATTTPQTSRAGKKTVAKFYDEFPLNFC